ncbi:TIGR02206 family membrane protein [Mycoplasmatota bacterium]|nr:TIGR02206 family membrane protein [Mycoplasmatota bacterium]
MLPNFFSTEPDPKMTLYSLEHIIPLLITIVLVILLYYKRNFFKSWKYEKHFRIFLVIFLIFCEITIVLWRGLTGTYNITHTLPLHLCSFSALAIEIVLITKSKKIMDFVYYISIGGAFIAMFYPDLRFTHLQYRYWEFFIFHILIIFSTYYMVFVHDLVPSKNSILKSMLIVHIIAIPIIVVNTLIDGSYMMLVNTSVPLLVDLFGEWPKYIIGLELLLIGLFSVNFIITYLFIYRNKQLKGEIL